MALAVAAGWAGAAGPLWAAAAEVPPGLSWTATPAVVSQYMFRGVRLGGPAFQPTLEVTRGGFAGGIWASVPLEKPQSGESDQEYNLYGSHSFAVNDTWSVAAGGTWYVMPRADPAEGSYRQTLEGYIGIDCTLGGVRFSPRVFHDVVLEATTAELTAAYAWPLQRLGTELVFTGAAGTFKADQAVENASPAVRNWGNYWSAGVTLPFQVTANGRISVGIGYHRGYGHYSQQGGAPKQASTSGQGRGVVTLAYTFSF